MKAVLSVSPIAEDASLYEAISSRPGWKLYTSDSIAGSLAVIRRRQVGVVICEADLRPGTWIEMLDRLRHLPGAPPLIVASRLADERLWAAALNLGAYDVLARPFAREELLRTVELAWLQWRQARAVFSTNAVRTMRTAC